MRSPLYKAAAVALALMASLTALGKPISIRVLSLQNPLPAPPAGYTWKICNADKIKFLIPTGWAVRNENGKDYVHCATSSNLAASAVDFSGLEIVLFFKPYPWSQSPWDFWIKKLESARTDASAFSESAYEDKLFSYRIAYITWHNQKSVVALAHNKKSGSVVQLLLTAPSQRWPEIEATGRVMFQFAAVNTEM